MGIRGRLLTLSLGIALPLVLVGLADLWISWTTNRRELDALVEQQARLTAITLDEWVVAQKQTLDTALALYAEGQGMGRTPIPLQAFLVTRPQWLDLHVLDASRNQVAVVPADAPPLGVDVAGEMFAELRRHQSVMVTDWKRDGRHPAIIIAAATNEGGAMVARINAAALQSLFRDIERENRLAVTVYDSYRRILHRSLTPDTYVGEEVRGSPLFDALGDGETAVTEAASPVDGVRRVYGLARRGESGCIVSVGVPSDALYAPARRQFTRFAMLGLLALLCGIVAALLIARSIDRPIRRLSRAAKRLGEGDLTHRVPIVHDGEIEELSRAFNSMADRLEERDARLLELDRLKSEFVGGVSHELRTPLTTIKTLTRIMQHGAPSEEERQEYLEDIATECDRQIDLVLNLLDLSRIEAGAFEITRSAVDVAEVVQACLRIERHVAEARSQSLTAKMPARLPHVAADHAALRRVLCSLIENAIKYTPEGGRITLAAHAAGDRIAIEIADTGRGINSEDLPCIFEKFHRGRPIATSTDSSSESSEHPEVPGVGLGLYLARKIIEQLSGTISVESTTDRGSTFTVQLPVSSEERTTRPSRKRVASRTGEDSG